MENKWDLLVRVVGAQLSPYWPNGRLEFPQIKWYKLIIINSIYSAQYTSTPAYHPDPPSDISEGLVPRLRTTNVATNMLQPLYCGFAVGELLIQNWPQ